jgi:hypothetical protein
MAPSGSLAVLKLSNGAIVFDGLEPTFEAAPGR